MKIKSLISFLFALVFFGCGNQIDKGEIPAKLEFELLRTKSPLTNTVPSELRYQYLNRKILGEIGIHNKTLRIFPNSWSPVDDYFAVLSVQQIVYDPKNPSTYYFCTGEGWNNADAARGAGVWKSIDAGKSWIQLASTANDTFFYCQDIIVHPTTSDVYVSTRQGLMRSQDGGTSWEQVLGRNNGELVNSATDLELTADGDILVAFGIFELGGVYLSSTGNKGDWNKLAGLPNAHRIEIATAKSNKNVIYALPTSPSDRLIIGVYKSTNKGSTWTQVALPGGNRNVASTQGWYDLIIEVDPNNENVVAVGGLHIWRSMNGGTSWQQLTQGNRQVDVGLPYVHVDQHNIVFQNSDTVYFTNDGGIYRCDNFRSGFPTFQNMNKNYNVTQYYSGDIREEKSSSRIIGGTQDNGSSGATDALLREFEFISGSDGGYCAIDFENFGFEYTTTQYATVYRHSDGVQSNITNREISQQNVLFINPLAMDVNDPQTLYQASNNGVWRLKNARTASRDDWERITTGFGVVTALATSKAAPNLLLIARNGGSIFKLEDSHLSTATTFPTAADKNQELPLSGNYPNCIVMNQKDAEHALVVYSNYDTVSVYETRNLSDDDPTWIKCEGNLPNIPIRWAALHPLNDRVCYLATELGIYYTVNLDGNNTVWTKSPTGFPNLRVDMIKIRESDFQILAATHGRGFFSGTIENDLSIKWQERGPNNIGGRTRDIMIDPNDKSQKKIWAASVSGGLWVAQDIDSINYFYDKTIEEPIAEVPKSVIFPNPFFETINIVFDTALTQEREIEIFNVEGKKVLSKKIKIGEKKLVLYTKELSPGTYFARIKGEDFVLTAKLQKHFR